MRVFAAIRPPEPVLTHLGSALAARAQVDRGRWRWVPPEDQHVTVAFFGEVPDGAVPELTELLARTAHAALPFEIELHGAGLLDDRVLWVGVGGHRADLARLMADAGAAGTGLGLAADRRRARAHLTVARISDQREAVGGRRHRGGAGRPPAADLVRALAVYRGPAWTVHEVHLVASELGAGRGGRPLYTDLARLPLWAATRRGEPPAVAG